jgi:mono/diheme cytochrome c family protein
MSRTTKNPFPPVLLVLLALTASPTGCGPERRGEPYTEPLAEARDDSPVDPADPAIARGHRAFSLHCHQCHPGGAAGQGPAINDKPLPVALMKNQVRAGHGAMPAFNEEEVGDDELEAIVRYLKALRALDERRG